MINLTPPPPPPSDLGQPQREGRPLRAAAANFLRRASAIRSRLVLLVALFALLTAGIAALHSTPAQAQTSFTVDVRIAAKPVEHGAHEFALRLGNDEILPEHRYLTATKASLTTWDNDARQNVGQWNRSSEITRSVTDPANPTNSETLILAIDARRDPASGRIELAVLNGAQRVLPTTRILPQNIRSGSWFLSSTVQISLPQAAVPGGTMIPAAIQMSTGTEPVEAHLSVPASDGTEESGFPARNPHFYQAGASALTLNVHVGEVVNASHRIDARRCDAGTTGTGCIQPITFNTDWNPVEIVVQAWNGSEWVSPDPSLGITFSVPSDGSICSGSASCSISRSAWMGQQSGAIATSEIAPLTMVLNTAAGATAPIRIWAHVGVTVVGEGDTFVWSTFIMATPDLTPTPKMFFFDTSSGVRPCSDAQMTAEAGDDCDPVVPDGDAVRIGFTILNGSSADHVPTESDTGSIPNRVRHQRSFNDFDRIELISDGPGSFSFTGTGFCTTYSSSADSTSPGIPGFSFVGIPATQTESARLHGACTISSASWYQTASTWGLDAAPDMALSQAETVGHGSILFRPWPTGGTRNYTITANLYRQPNDADPPETPVSTTIVVEDISVAPMLQPHFQHWNDGKSSLSLQRRNNCVTRLVGGGCNSTAAEALFSAFASSGPMVVLAAQPGHVSLRAPALNELATVACAIDGPTACTTSITKAQLKESVITPIEMGDTWPITGLRGELNMEYVAPLDTEGPAVVSARLIDKEGVSRSATTSYEFSRVAVPIVEAQIAEDADGALEPEQTTALRIGVRIVIDQPSLSDPTAQTLFATDVGSFVWRNQMRNDLQGVEVRLAPSSYFVLSDGATWASGGTRLHPDGLFRCDYDEQASGGGAVFFCWLQQRQPDGTLAAPQITVADDATGEIQVTANFIAAEGEKFLINYRRERETSWWTDATWRQFNYRRTHDAGDSLFGTTTLPVGEKARLESASLRRAGDATGTIRARGNAAVELALRDQNGNPAQIGTVSAITVTATAGTLGGSYCGGVASCTIDLADGSAFRTAVAENPALAAAIPVTFTAPDESGTASISAAVVGADGGTPAADPIEIAYSSDAATIMLGSEMPRVLAWGTPDADDPATPNVDEQDDRDVAQISVSSADSQGRSADLPQTVSARLINPEGDAVGSDAVVSTVCAEVGGVEDRADCKFEVDVNADRATPLASGLYMLRASFGGETREAVLTIAGAPAAITADPAPALPGLGETFSWGVGIADETGVPVADGTSVRFSTPSTGEGMGPLLLVSPAGGAATAKNGRAEATFAVISRGVGIISVEAGDAAAAEPARHTLVVEAAPHAAELAEQMIGLPPVPDGQPAGGVSAATGIASFSGSSSASASSVLSALDGRRSILIWNGRRWIRYAVDADGTPLPGSTDFTLLPGDVIWLGE